MPKPDSKELKEYKEYVRKRLTKLTPILQKAAMGDFTEEIKIPEKEDEFSELLVGLSLMIDDLRELKKVQEKVEKERIERLAELERWKKITVGRELKMAELKQEIEKLKEEIENFGKNIR